MNALPGGVGNADRPTWQIAAAGAGIALICLVLARVTPFLVADVFAVGVFIGFGIAVFSPLISKRLNGNSRAIPPGAAATPVAPTNTLAILAIVFAFLLPLLGVIFGHAARSQIRRSGEQGDGLALAGLTIGYLGIAASAAMLIFVARGL